MAKLSKSEQKEAMKKLKEDQMRRLAMLSQQYDSSISEMVEHQNVSRPLLNIIEYTNTGSVNSSTEN